MIFSDNGGKFDKEIHHNQTNSTTGDICMYLKVMVKNKQPNKIEWNSEIRRIITCDRHNLKTIIFF